MDSISSRAHLSDQQSCSTLGKLSTYMDDCLQIGKPSRYVTSCLGQFSLPSLRG